MKNKFPKWLKVLLIAIGAFFSLLTAVAIGIAIFDPDSAARATAEANKKDSIEHAQEVVKEKADREYEDAINATKREQKRLSELEELKPIALLMSNKFVEKILKAPATAKFASSENSTTKWHPDSTYEVTSYVDAENTFGALLRSNYYCKLRYTGDDNWQCLQCKLLE